jgi:hypothetical protein
MGDRTCLSRHGERIDDRRLNAFTEERLLYLKRRIQGHFNYFGVSGNFRSLLRVTEQAKRIWYKWLCRRSQRKRLTWERFADLLRDFPLPKPRITVKIWGS